MKVKSSPVEIEFAPFLCYEAIETMYLKSRPEGRLEGMSLEYGHKCVLASIYSLRSDRDESVLKILAPYIYDLTKLVPQDILEAVQNKYEAVVSESIGIIEQSYYKDILPNHYLVDCCARLMNLTKDSSVYIPYSGIGESVAAFKDCKIVGEEMDMEKWAWSQIYVNAIGSNSDLDNDISYQRMKNREAGFDGIFYKPPFYSAINMWSDIEIALGLLKDSGTIVAVLPMHFVCRPLEYKRLLPYISAIVELRKPYEGQTTEAIIVKLQKRESKDILFAYDEFCIGYDFLPESLEKKYNSFVKSIDISNLEVLPHIQPKRFFIKNEGLDNPTKFSDIVELYETNLHDGIVYNPQGFTDEWMKCALSLNETKASRAKSFVDDGNAILMRVSNNRVLFGQTGEETKGHLVSVDNHGTFAFRIKNEATCNKRYLLYLLSSSIVAKQVDAYCYGAIGKCMDVQDFMDITIPLPSRLSDQVNIVLDAEKKLMDQYGFTQVSSDIAHMLGTPFSRISTAISNLEFSSNLSEEDRIDLNSIKANFGYMNRLLKMNAGADFNLFEKKNVNLNQFLNKYIEQWGKYGSNTFSVQLNVTQSLKEKEILANEDALSILFDCLFDNANRHGFKKIYSQDNQVNISIMPAINDDGMECLRLIVGNNGAPMPQGFSINDYIAKGKYSSQSGRSGLGGYHVNRIVESMGGKILDISSRLDWTRIEFVIPIV